MKMVKGPDRTIEREGTSFKTNDWEFNLTLRCAKAFLKRFPGNLKLISNGTLNKLEALRRNVISA